MASKEWRTVKPPISGLRHVVEVVYGGQRVYFCRQTTVAHTVPFEPITEDTPFTCLWCAAWWQP